MAQLVGASTRYVKFAGSIPGQGTYTTQGHGTTNLSLSLSLSLSLTSVRRKKKTAQTSGATLSCGEDGFLSLNPNFKNQKNISESIVATYNLSCPDFNQQL